MAGMKLFKHAAAVAVLATILTPFLAILDFEEIRLFLGKVMGFFLALVDITLGLILLYSIYWWVIDATLRGYYGRGHG